MQEIGKSADFVLHFLKHVDGVGNCLAEGLLRKCVLIEDRAEEHRDGCKVLTRHVVQVSSNSAALIVRKLKDSGGEFPELGLSFRQSFAGLDELRDFRGCDADRVDITRKNRRHRKVDEGGPAGKLEAYFSFDGTADCV